VQPNGQAEQLLAQAQRAERAAGNTPPPPRPQKPRTSPAAADGVMPIDIGLYVKHTPYARRKTRIVFH